MRRGVAVGLLGVLGAVAIGAITVYWWQTGEPASAPNRQQPAPQVATHATPSTAQPAPAKPPSTGPDFDVVRVRPDGQTVIAGRADPGASVTILDGEKVVATVTADARGEWVALPDQPLAPGSHELSLTEKSPGGVPDQKSANVVVVSVPEPKQAASGEAAQPLAVLMPRQGGGAAKTLQAPGSAPSLAPVGPGAPGTAPQIGIVQYDGAGHLSVSGRAAPDERVLLYIENKPVGDTRADAHGDWSVKLAETVAAGNYALRVDSIGKDDKVRARAQLQFRRVEVPKELAGNQFLVVQPGDTLWHIARRTYGEGLLFTDIYRANRNEIVDPNLIYPGQVVALPPG
ncbi:MAG TPA: LysM peptidoglycan-binding domain-containing protein [Stellaceae bacterium]|nr:LysM peptidoglycan-binding domain-containing protein [Stellaceae bacterium]